MVREDCSVSELFMIIFSIADLQDRITGVARKLGILW